MDGHFMTETTRTCRVWISGMVSRRIWRFVAHLYTARAQNLTTKQWYDPDAVTTKDGVLELRFDNFTNHDLKYRSGMVQSWNKMCFRGGRLEASISLPGDGEVSGFWPGFWAMGNLGRPGYRATTDGMWPYSYYDGCDAGITPNQSSTDGVNFLPGMRLPACTCVDGEHPTPGKSRGAPEIDVIEASVSPINGDGKVVGSVSQSLQMAPFDVWYMPDYGKQSIISALALATSTHIVRLHRGVRPPYHSGQRLPRRTAATSHVWFNQPQ